MRYLIAALFLAGCSSMKMNLVKIDESGGVIRVDGRGTPPEKPEIDRMMRATSHCPDRFQFVSAEQKSEAMLTPMYLNYGGQIVPQMVPGSSLFLEITYRCVGPAPASISAP